MKRMGNVMCCPPKDGPDFVGALEFGGDKCFGCRGNFGFKKACCAGFCSPNNASGAAYVHDEFLPRSWILAYLFENALAALVTRLLPW